MALPISRNQTVRFVPAAYGPAARGLAEAAADPDLRRFDHPVAYIVTVPSVLERAAWRRSVASLARFVSQEDLLAELRRQVAGAFDEGDPDLERWIGVLDAHQAVPEGAEVPPALQADLERLETTIQGASSAYAELVAARSYWFEVAPIVACQHFLKARENPDHIFRRRNGLVLDSDLAEVPEGDLKEVGYHIMSLMRPSKDQEKNSAPPSSSPADPMTSPAASEPPTAADGTSSATTGSETRAST